MVEPRNPASRSTRTASWATPDGYQAAPRKSARWTPSGCAHSLACSSSGLQDRRTPSNGSGQGSPPVRAGLSLSQCEGAGHVRDIATPLVGATKS